MQKSTVSQSCKRDCLDFAERMKRKALRVRSEGSIPPYVTEAESRKQHSDSPLCNSLKSVQPTLVTLLYVSVKGCTSVAQLGGLSSHCHIKHTKRLCLSRSRERRKFKTYSESRHSGFHAKGVGCCQRISESRYPTTSDLERSTAAPRFFCFMEVIE